MRLGTIICGALLVFCSCRQDFGNRLESKELTVFYTRTQDEPLARQVGEFWKRNNFLGQRHQYIQLDHSSNRFELKLIANQPDELKNMSYNERKLLMDLQQTLKDSLFRSHNFSLILANANFETLYSLNPNP